MTLWWQVHTPKRVKLIDSKGELMNCIGFKGMSLLMKYETHNLQGWIF
jgi:hypothetical protein